MKVGLVLQGGGIKGSYQIGSYYAFRKCHIKFDGFAGASIGSCNAAVLACGKHKELLDVWININPGEIFGVDEKLIEAINTEGIDLKNGISGALESIKGWIKTKGISIDPVMAELNKYIDEGELRRSKKDFGLVTVKLKDLSAKYMYIENIPVGKLHEYIMASCYMPVFKINKIIDNNIYLDGGFADNCPVTLLLKKNYDKIYAVKIDGLGFDKKISKEDSKKITYIEPSRNICKILECNTDIIKENIKMGYYDTLRILKKYDGYKYTIKKHNNYYYKLLTRKIDSKLYNRISNYLNTKSIKETVVKAIEYIAEKQNINYYKVYKLKELIKIIKSNATKNGIIIDFINQLKIF